MILRAISTIAIHTQDTDTQPLSIQLCLADGHGLKPAEILLLLRSRLFSGLVLFPGPHPESGSRCRPSVPSATKRQR